MLLYIMSHTETWKKQRKSKVQRWLNEYKNFDIKTGSKIELFQAIRKYKTYKLNARCVSMRMNSSTTKTDLQKQFKSALRGAKRIVNTK